MAGHTAASISGDAPVPAEAGIRRRWPFVGLAIAQVVLVLTAIGSLASGVGADGACAVDKSNPGSDILGCLRESTAYIRTPVGSGTGMLLDDGHVVTNAHVISPFGRVSVVVAGRSHADVPVVGVDFAGDIAVLGPIEEAPGGITFGVSEEVEDGSSLFLLGYPGEVDEEPDPTIAQGILSRRRDSEEFGLHYLQTDASIGGGQSGGALVNNRGEVVGISTLKFAESFALALSAEDTGRAIDRILDGDGDEVVTWPVDGEKDTRSRLNDFGSVMLLVPAQEERTDLRVTVPPDAGLLALDLLGPPLGASASYLDLLASPFDLEDLEDIDLPALEDIDLDDIDIDETNEPFLPPLLDELDRVGPNRYEVSIKDGQLVILEIIPADNASVIDVESSLGVERFDPGPGRSRQVQVGDTARGTLDGLATSHEYQVRLERGQEVEIRAASPSADMVLSISGPDDLPWDAEVADDGGGGLYDLDASLAFEAEATGVHTIEVGSIGFSGTAYLLEIAEQ